MGVFFGRLKFYEIELLGVDSLPGWSLQSASLCFIANDIHGQLILIMQFRSSIMHSMAIALWFCIRNLPLGLASKILGSVPVKGEGISS